MKKAVALFLALIMTMSIVACGSNNAGNTTNNTTNNSSNTSDTDTEVMPAVWFTASPLRSR